MTQAAIICILRQFGGRFSIASALHMDILLTMADVHSSPELLSFPCKGPLITQPRAVFIAYGPSPLLLTTSQGSNIFGALLPINRSTLAIMLGILIFPALCEGFWEFIEKVVIDSRHLQA